MVAEQQDDLAYAYDGVVPAVAAVDQSTVAHSEAGDDGAYGAEVEPY